MEVTFSATDAGIESFKLLRHFDDERPLDLIFKGQTQQNPFTILVGDRDGYALTGNYSCSADSDSIRFTGRFAAPAIQPEPFDITITYTFVPDEYLFQQEIEFRNSVNRQIPLAGGAGAAGGGSGGYTLFIGPQIGPEFAMLDNRSEFRKYITLDGRDRDSTRLNGRRTDTLVAPRDVDWVAIAGKYFALAAIPHTGIEQTFVSAVDKEGVPAVSELYLVRTPIQSSAQADTYRFYFGPKQRQELIKYDNAEDNSLGIQGLDLRRVQDSRPLLGWLEAILKAILTLLYQVIPNYGIAIIILTIICEDCPDAAYAKRAAVDGAHAGAGAKDKGIARAALHRSPAAECRDGAAVQTREGKPRWRLPAAIAANALFSGDVRHFQQSF